MRLTATAAGKGKAGTNASRRRRFDLRALPLLAVAAGLALILGPLAGILLAALAWVWTLAWKTPLPAWLRAVLVAFSGLAGVLLYLIGTAILALVLRP